MRPAFGLGLLILVSSGCGTWSGQNVGNLPQSFRLSEIAESGDPQRNASLRLLIEGLEADAAGRSRRAQGSYEHAIQVDPTNPYAYLLLARHDVERAAPEAALELLGQAKALLQSEGPVAPSLRAHLIGLRGRALYMQGRLDEAQRELERARVLAPVVWQDGFLSPRELL